MKLFLTFALACTGLAAAQRAIDPALVDEIHAKTSMWRAELSPRFEGLSRDDARRLCGTVIGPHAFRLPELEPELEAVGDLPASFDARQNWPECSGVIGRIRDQSNCGSCWAVSSTATINDRMCIVSSGKFQTELSAQDTTSCCDLLKCFSMGCNGGQPSGAFSYFAKYGVVSGGEYSAIGKGDSCFPYQLAPCAHHVVSPGLQNCTGDASTPACPTACSEKSYGTAWAQDKHTSKTAYSVSGVQNIMAEIAKNGPVTAAFTVYDDFLAYKSGVYHHVSGSQLGGHAVKIMGWGTESGVDYWLVANSWNTSWGDQGTFKIRRGNDECGIESQISAGSA